VLWGFFNKKTAVQPIAGSEGFAEARAATPQVQALCGTNPVGIVIFPAPVGAACPEVKAFGGTNPKFEK